jgi:hypothetical protein
MRRRRDDDDELGEAGSIDRSEVERELERDSPTPEPDEEPAEPWARNAMYGTRGWDGWRC